jgi:regulator of replication initiation timing
MEKFGIFKNIDKYSFEQIIDGIELINKKDNCLYIITREKYNTNNGNWGILFKVYDKDMNRSLLKHNGWIVESEFQTGADWCDYKRKELYVRIYDIKGHDRMVEIGYQHVRNLFNYILLNSKYYIWENKDLSEENTKLKNEVTHLSSKCEQLQSKLSGSQEIIEENKKFKTYISQIKDILSEKEIEEREEKDTESS